MKVFSAKWSVLLIHESFLPQKFPAIQYNIIIICLLYTIDPPTSMLYSRHFEEKPCKQHCTVRCLCTYKQWLLLHVTLIYDLSSCTGIGITYIFLLTTVTSLVLGLAFKLSQAPVDTATPYLSNTTAVVANSSQVHALQVIQDAGFPGDNEHEIDLYRVKSQCSELATFSDSYIKEGNNFTSINSTTTYAWTGSILTLHICGSTNQSTQKWLDAIIVKGLDDLQFTEKESLYKGLHFSSGINGEWKCTEEKINTDDPNYYTMIFLPRAAADHDHFNYSVTYDIKSADLAQLPITATLHKDQDKWVAPQPSWFRKNFCVIGTFKNVPDTSVNGRVHIRTHYDIDTISTEIGEGFLLGSIILLFTGISCVILLVTYCMCKYCSKKKYESFDGTVAFV